MKKIFEDAEITEFKKANKLNEESLFKLLKDNNISNIELPKILSIHRCRAVLGLTCRTCIYNEYCKDGFDTYLDNFERRTWED